MFKVSILLLLLLLTEKTFAGYGIITVLEAPIHIKPRLNTKVIQYHRKGDKIYIPNRYFNKNNIQTLLPQDSNFEKDIEYGPLSYIEVLTRNGGQGYILKDHVKLIYGDRREFSEHIRPYKKDPTDYRLQEPLPQNYPLQKRREYRAGISYTWGPELSNNYSYNRSINKQETSSRSGLQLYYLKRANWDKLDQFYIGGVLTWWTSTSRFGLTDQSTAKETLSQLSLGPMVTYDLWRTKNYALTTEATLLISYTNQTVLQFDEVNDFSTQKEFTGLTVMPKFASHFAFKNIVEDLDIILGVESQFFLPHKLTSKQAVNSNLWNNQTSDQIDVPFNIYWNAFIGVRGRY